MKLIVFLPIIIFFAFFGILILAFLGFIAKIIFKSKADFWTGTIISKAYNTKREMGHSKHIEQFYSVRIKTDDGREFNWAVTSDEYNSFTEGDRLQKLKGELKAKKI